MLQAKLLRAEQQQAFAEEFSADARRSLSADDAQQAELAATKRAVSRPCLPALPAV
jgi:hypothetical protein